MLTLIVDVTCFVDFNIHPDLFLSLTAKEFITNMAQFPISYPKVDGPGRLLEICSFHRSKITEERVRRPVESWLCPEANLGFRNVVQRSLQWDQCSHLQVSNLTAKLGRDQTE